MVRLPKGKPVWLDPIAQVFVSTDHYAIFTYHDGVLGYATDASLSSPGKDFNAIWNKVQEVKALPVHNAKDVRERVNASLATATACGFEGDLAGAQEAVDQAKSILIGASLRAVKTAYLPTAAVTGALVFALGFYLFLNTPAAPTTFQATVWRLFVVSLAGGSLGALMSALAMRPGSRLDPLATKRAARIDGALRILYGIVTALVVVIAVETGFVTSDFVTSDETGAAILLIAVAGGFLERWAVDIVRRVAPEDEEKVRG